MYVWLALVSMNTFQCIYFTVPQPRLASAAAACCVHRCVHRALIKCLAVRCVPIHRTVNVHCIIGVGLLSVCRMIVAKSSPFGGSCRYHIAALLHASEWCIGCVGWVIHYGHERAVNPSWPPEALMDSS